MRNKEGTSTDGTENKGGIVSAFFQNMMILYTTICHQFFKIIDKMDTFLGNCNLLKLT